MSWHLALFWGLLWFASGLDNTLLAQQDKPNPASPSANSPNAVRPMPPTDEELGDKTLPPGEDPQNRLFVPLLKHMARDQQTFWTFPARVRSPDLRWMLPAAAFTGSVFASDSWIARQVPQSATRIKQSKDVSNYAVFSLIGVTGGSYFFGQLTHNDHLQETGFLSGEAAIDSTAAAYVLKEITRRERPYQGNGHGTFFRGGSSFPSEHATVAWSAASVFAHEYPGTLSQIFAYGLASAVTVTRITSKQHFASDALIGSALGWYFGRQVYRAHHDPEIGGTSWGSILPEDGGEKVRTPSNMGSPYVPLDRWVYSAFDRLAALGYVQDGFVGMRPWTRKECARLVQQANEEVPGGGDEVGTGAKILIDLEAEFQPEMSRLEGASNLGASLDSVYNRATGIAGPPLRNGFDFAQSIFNDYGRPYGEGFNNITGIVAHAEAGPFSVFVRGEYQRSPMVPSDPLNVLQTIAAAEEPTRVLPDGFPATNRLRLLDAAVGFTFKDIQVSFGQQSLWLGPSPGGPFLFSDNAEPIPMLRFDRTSPIRLPGVSRILGPMRAEFAVGRLSGAHWILANGQLFGPHPANQPFVHLEKVSFKPTANLEFGMGISVIWGGPGQAVTWKSFIRSFTILGNSTALPGTQLDPGDRRSTAEFTYRLPHLRDWVTLYGDSFVEDEVSPIGSSRPSLRQGLYFARLPKVPNLDLRVEAVYTDTPHSPNVPGNIYDNGRFRSGYTNNGLIMGSWVGRAGKGGQAWATYWISSQTTVQAFYRRLEVSPKFLEGGGLNDIGVKAEIRARRDLSVQAVLQYEKWKFPLLAPTAQSNLTASVQLTFYPKWRIRK